MSQQSEQEELLSKLRAFLSTKLEELAYQRDYIDLLEDAELCKQGQKIYWSLDAQSILEDALKELLNLPNPCSVLSDYLPHFFKESPYESLGDKARQFLAEAHPAKRDKILSGCYAQIENAFVTDVLMSHKISGAIRHLNPRRQERFINKIGTQLFEKLPEGAIQFYITKIDSFKEEPEPELV